MKETHVPDRSTWIWFLAVAPNSGFLLRRGSSIDRLTNRVAAIHMEELGCIWLPVVAPAQLWPLQAPGEWLSELEPLLLYQSVSLHCQIKLNFRKWYRTCAASQFFFPRAVDFIEIPRISSGYLKKIRVLFLAGLKILPVCPAWSFGDVKEVPLWVSGFYCSGGQPVMVCSIMASNQWQRNWLKCSWVPWLK